MQENEASAMDGLKGASNLHFQCLKWNFILYLLFFSETCYAHTELFFFFFFFTQLSFNSQELC